MVFMTISEVIPFTLFFILWIIFFTVVYITLKVDFSGIDDYPQIPETVVAVFNTYRTSIGDLQAPSYAPLYDSTTDQSKWP